MLEEIKVEFLDLLERGFAAGRVLDPRREHAKGRARWVDEKPAAGPRTARGKPDARKRGRRGRIGRREEKRKEKECEGVRA